MFSITLALRLSASFDFDTESNSVLRAKLWKDSWIYEIYTHKLCVVHVDQNSSIDLVLKYPPIKAKVIH